MKNRTDGARAALADRIEPEALAASFNSRSDNEVALMSIAISLKRIANCFEKETRVGGAIYRR